MLTALPLLSASQMEHFDPSSFPTSHTGSFSSAYTSAYPTQEVLGYMLRDGLC